MKIILNLQSVCCNLNTIPNKSILKKWIECIFLPLKKKIELTIRIVDEKESQALNMYFLKKNYPTNILSFPFYPPLGINSYLIGDLVLCQKIIENEAKMHKVSIESYMAHIIIHGSLHLLGYNHTTDNENINMMNLENKIMKQLGYIKNVY